MFKKIKEFRENFKANHPKANKIIRYLWRTCVICLFAICIMFFILLSCATCRFCGSAGGKYETANASTDSLLYQQLHPTILNKNEILYNTTQQLPIQQTNYGQYYMHTQGAYGTIYNFGDTDPAILTTNGLPRADSVNRNQGVNGDCFTLRYQSVELPNKNRISPYKFAMGWSQTYGNENNYNANNNSTTVNSTYSGQQINNQGVNSAGQNMYYTEEMEYPAQAYQIYNLINGQNIGSAKWYTSNNNNTIPILQMLNENQSNTTSGNVKWQTNNYGANTFATINYMITGIVYNLNTQENYTIGYTIKKRNVYYKTATTELTSVLLGGTDGGTRYTVLIPNIMPQDGYVAFYWISPFLTDAPTAQKINSISENSSQTWGTFGPYMTVPTGSSLSTNQFLNIFLYGLMYGYNYENTYNAESITLGNVDYNNINIYAIASNNNDGRDNLNNITNLIELNNFEYNINSIRVTHTDNVNGIAAYPYQYNHVVLYGTTGQSSNQYDIGYQQGKIDGYNQGFNAGNNFKGLSINFALDFANQFFATPFFGGDFTLGWFIVTMITISVFILFLKVFMGG